MMDLDCVMDSDYMEGYERRRFLSKKEYATQVRYLTDEDLRNEFEMILKEREQEKRRTKSESMSSASSEGTVIDDIHRPSGYCCFCQKGKPSDTLISCDKCNKWDHASCAGISDEDTATKRYVCPICDPASNQNAPGYAVMLKLQRRQKRRLNRKRKRLDSGSDEWQPPASKKRRNMDLSLVEEDETNLNSGKSSSKKKFNKHTEAGSDLGKLLHEHQKTRNQINKLKKSKKKKKKIIKDEFSSKSGQEVLDMILDATRELESIACKNQYDLKLKQIQNEYEETIAKLNSNLQNVTKEFESFRKKSDGRKKRHRESMKKNQQEFKKQVKHHQEELEKCQDTNDQLMTKNITLSAEVQRLKLDLETQETEMEKLKKKATSLEMKTKKQNKELIKLRKAAKKKPVVKRDEENINPITPHYEYSYTPISGELNSGQLISGTLFSPRRNMCSGSSESEDSSKDSSPKPVLKQKKLNRVNTTKKRKAKAKQASENECSFCGSKANIRRKIFTCYHTDCNKSYHLECNPEDHQDYRNCPFEQKWFCVDHRHL